MTMAVPLCLACGDNRATEDDGTCEQCDPPTLRGTA